MVFLDYTTASSTVSGGTLFTASYKCMICIRINSVQILGGSSVGVIYNSGTNENVYVITNDEARGTGSQSTIIMHAGESLIGGAFDTLNITYHIFRIPESP